ncbi:hypothetical protein AJ87_12855 [Rhizobium yanglingense]|nr:hypothetical protein AJ87_12855 [Rhizobium yanglingense]
MSNANRLERAAAGAFAIAALLAGTASHAQVPVIDNARQKIQQATLNWYQSYQADTRKVKGASGGTTDSVAPGQGSGAPADCSADRLAGDNAPAAPSQRTPSQQEVARMVEEEAIRQGSIRISRWQSPSRNPASVSPPGRRSAPRASCS